MRPAFLFGCPTWIRTKTNSTKNCRTTIILSGNPSLTKFKGCKSKYSPHVNQISSTDKLIGCNQVIIFFALLDQYIFIV